MHSLEETLACRLVGFISHCESPRLRPLQMLAYAAGVLVPATESFVWLMVGSCCVVCAAAALYTAFALRARCGQGMHVALQPV